MQVTYYLPFSTSQQHIYCLIMQSHELDTTKPTNRFPRVIILEKLCVSKGIAVIFTNSCWRGGGHGNKSIGEVLLATPFCSRLTINRNSSRGLFRTVSFGKLYLQNIWLFFLFIYLFFPYPGWQLSKV